MAKPCLVLDRNESSLSAEDAGRVVKTGLSDVPRWDEEALEALACLLATARQQSGNEGDGKQRHRADLLHRLADALIEQAHTFAARLHYARHRTPRFAHKQGQCGEDQNAEQSKRGGDDACGGG